MNMQIPSRLIRVTVGTLPLSVQGKVHEWEGTNESLLFTGPTGSGKSWAAAATAMSRRDGMARQGPGYMSLHEVYVAPERRPLVWANVPNLAGDLRNSEIASDVTEICQEAKLLVLDDLGAEKESDFLVERIYAIVSFRYEWERPTIVTSNLDLEQMNALWPRMASRLCSGTIVAMGGADRRLAAHG